MSIRLLYTINQRQINDSLHYLKLFTRYHDLFEETYTYTIEDDGKYIVLHDPETGDMCHLHNHPRIVEALRDYRIIPQQMRLF